MDEHPGEREHERAESAAQRRVNAPCPPKALTAYEVVVLWRMVESQMRRVRRRMERSVEVGRTLPGGDANLQRSVRLAALEAKLDAWLDAMWPEVERAYEALGLDFDDDEEVEYEDGPEVDREEWLREARDLSSRLAQADA